MSKVDRRSLLGSDDKVETETVEPSPEPAAAAEDDLVQPLQPLNDEFIDSMATRWPLTAHGRELARNLPKALMKMLEQQNDDFLRGFANGTQAVHDLCIKVLMDELQRRVMEIQMSTGVPITDEMLTNQDRLVAVAATQVEGLCFMACKTMIDRNNVSKTSN